MARSLFSELPRRSDARIPIRETIAEAAGYWERRRIWYNVALTLLGIGWVVATWPHFRPAFKMSNAGKILVLALLANLCYSVAYAVDVPMSRSSLKLVWQRRRGILWGIGTIAAVLFAYYWIADEIYPDVG